MAVLVLVVGRARVMFGMVFVVLIIEGMILILVQEPPEMEKNEEKMMFLAWK